MTRAGLAGRPTAGGVLPSASSTTYPVAMSGRTALVTAAEDSPVLRAISTRESGPWDRAVVNTGEAAGVGAGNVSTRLVDDMAGNVGELISSAKKKGNPDATSYGRLGTAGSGRAAKG